jgi:hypothetical protein
METNKQTNVTKIRIKEEKFANSENIGSTGVGIRSTVSDK